MDLKRAKQIISSSKEITVTYHDVPVRLKNCNETDNTVSVYMETKPAELMDLPVAELEEK